MISGEIFVVDDDLAETRSLATAGLCKTGKTFPISEIDILFLVVGAVVLLVPSAAE